MTKREALDKLNRLLLVVEGLPENTSVLAATTDYGGTRIQVGHGAEVQFTARKRISLTSVERSTVIAGVTVLEVFTEPVQEGF
jgi:hypothetical protein